MEFHKKIKQKKEKEIINIKGIRQKKRYIQNNISSNVPNIKQSDSKKIYVWKKDMNKNDNNDYQDKNELFFNQIDSSLKDDINSKTDNKIKEYDFYRRLPNNSLEKKKREISIKNEYSKNYIVNPLNKLEYMNNSSRTIGTNSLMKNKYQDKYYNSLMIIDSSNNNNVNYNEIEANSDKERENSLKIRYHRAKRYSPFYKNTFGNNIYNDIYENEQDEDNNNENNIRTFRYNRENIDINDLSDLNQIKTVNNMNDKNLIYSSDEGCQESLKYEDNKIQKKSLVRKLTDLYDPNKNKKGILLPKSKMTFSLSSSPLSFDKRRNFSKNSKLSDLIMYQKKSSIDNIKVQSIEDFYSGSEDKTTWQNDTKKREKKTFNRRSFEKYQQNKTLIRLNKSPQERFRNISLAMISSKGKNTENRPILTNMRFERGGVVDLAQSDAKKNKYKYLIKKIKRPQIDQLIHNNPKYREKAAQLIKEWWFTIKEYRKKRNESAILIQSYFRGKFVRKYLYDVIYMNYIYFGFCKKIEKFIKKKYGPYFLKALFDKYIKQKIILKKIIEEQNKKIIKLYLERWNLINKKFNKKNLSLLYILRIRAIRESKMFNLKRVFSKWNYISIINKERIDNKLLMENSNKNCDNEEIENEINKIEKNNITKRKIYDDKNNVINKIKGLFKILNGTDIFMKKKALELTNPYIKKYLKEIIEKNEISKNDNEEILRIKIELFIKKLEPFVQSNLDLYNLFMKSIIIKIKKKKKRKKELDKDDYIYRKEYNKKIKKEKIEEYDLINYEEDEENEDSEENKNKRNDNENTDENEILKYKKEIEHLKKHYILINLLRIKKNLGNINIRKYFNIWKFNNKNDKGVDDKVYLMKLIKIQSFFRQMISKYKYEKLINLNNILFNIINRQNENNNNILLFNLRKWNLLMKQLSCIKAVEYIQNFYRKYKYNKNMNKIRGFLRNLFKYYILYAMKNIYKIQKLKSIIENISKNRIKYEIEKKVKNRRIYKILLKIINNNNNIYNEDLKKYYLNKWNNRKNILKNKDNKRKKRLLMKIFNKKDNLKNILKSYFLRWQRNHNLSLINDSVIIIQRNWKRKKISDIKNKKKKEQILFIKKINDKINKRRIKYYLYFFNTLKNMNKKYILSKLENNFTNRRINILKDVINKLHIYIKRKSLSRILSISDNLKKRILRKYIKKWKYKSSIKNKKDFYITKYLNKKEYMNKCLKSFYLYKWLYHIKYNKMKNNIEIIQKEYRNYKKNKIIKENWIRLKTALLNKENKIEINIINKAMKSYIFVNKIKGNFIKKIDKNIFNALKKYNKESLFKAKMKNIIIKLNNKRYKPLLKKYFNKWYNNINKEIEREEKLNLLLYTIEKRMNINSARFISQISLIKNIYDVYIKFRKFECFKLLLKYSKAKKYICDFSNNLSSAFDNIKYKEKKVILSKILKYFVFIKLIKLLERIKINRNKEVKQYKMKLIKYLKKKKEEYSSSEKRKKRYSNQFMSPKQKQKYDYTKKLDKSKTKSQGIITISNKKTQNYKEKEKDIIKKKIVKGFNSNNKKVYENKRGINNIFGKNKFNDDKISKGESEYESENNQIKENIEAIYEPLLGALNKVVNKIIIRKKKEYLKIIKKNIKIVEEEKEKERIFYIHKLYKALRSITIKKLFVQKSELLRAKKLINLIKLTRVNIQISNDRWIRQIIRRWRFISFVKIMSKKKLELMYKNLHVGYLEIINSLFNNESEFPSIIKEFDNFGHNIGMYKNSDILNKEKDLYQKVKKKYISKPIEYDKENLINIESGKFINDLKYKSDEEQVEDCNYTDSDKDKDVINKLNNRMRMSVNYDCDNP